MSFTWFVLLTVKKGSMAKHQRETINILKFWGFIGIHFVPLLAIFTGTFTFDWALALALYVIRMFFITAGYHRYFSHRTFKTSRVFQFLLAFFAQTSMQKGALWWAANHRIHHKNSDTLEDPHSAKLFGFWYAHTSYWIFLEYCSIVSWHIHHQFAYARNWKTSL